MCTPSATERIHTDASTRFCLFGLFDAPRVGNGTDPVRKLAQWTIQALIDTEAANGSASAVANAPTVVSPMSVMQFVAVPFPERERTLDIMASLIDG